MDLQRKKICLLDSEISTENCNSNFCFEKDTAQVLMNDVILRHIFDFLPISVFKNCRSVCQKWKSVGEAQFKKRARIFVDFTTENDKSAELFSSEHSVLEKLKQFFKNTMDESPFVALRLSGRLPWCPSTLSDFFSEEGKVIADLTFLDVALSHEAKEEDSPTIKRYPLSELISGMVNLKSLKIREYSDLSQAEKSTRFVLSLEDLSKIRFIHLEGCAIELSENSGFISPVELHLQSVAFYKNTLVNDLLLNDIVNFSLMKKLTVRSYNYEPRPSTMMNLSLIGKVKLSNLSLLGGCIQNWENSSWEINSMKLWNVPFVENNKLKPLKNFAIGNSECNLKCLPSSVAKLTLSYGLKITQSEDYFLPNVKRLELNHSDCTELFLPHLVSKFNNLVELSLIGSTSEDVNHFVNFDVNMIPKSVKTLCIQNDGFNFVGNGRVSLDTLILLGVKDEFVEEVKKHFSVKHLYK